MYFQAIDSSSPLSQFIIIMNTDTIIVKVGKASMYNIGASFLRERIEEIYSHSEEHHARMLQVSIRDLAGDFDQPHEDQYPLNQIIIKNHIRPDFIIKGLIPLSLVSQISLAYELAIQISSGKGVHVIAYNIAPSMFVSKGGHEFSIGEKYEGQLHETKLPGTLIVIMNCCQLTLFEFKPTTAQYFFEIGMLKNTGRKVDQAVFCVEIQNEAITVGKGEIRRKMIDDKLSIWNYSPSRDQPNAGPGSLIFGGDGFFGILGEYKQEPACFSWSDILNLYAELAQKKGRISLVVGKGIRGPRFQRFLSESPFEFLMNGDQIIGINNRWIASQDQLFSALLLEGSEILMRVMRRNQLLLYKRTLLRGM